MNTVPNPQILDLAEKPCQWLDQSDKEKSFIALAHVDKKPYLLLEIQNK